MPDVASSVRITAAAYGIAHRLAGKLGRSRAQVIEQALRQMEDQVFWQEVQEAYARMAEDPNALEAFRKEAAEWDGTIDDGLRGE